MGTDLPQLSGVDVYHLTPCGDLREHEASVRCWCRPELDPDAEGFVYVHRSMDGREAFETGERRPS